jgi:hypothetical protein
MSEQITIDAEADRMPSVTIPAHHCDTDPVASVVHRIDGWEAPKWATHSDFTENSSHPETCTSWSAKPR